MSTTGFVGLDGGCVGVLDRPFPACQVEEEDEPVQTTAPPDEPVEVEPQPDTAEPALEDSHTLLTQG